ncbi:hypothetical protein DFH07DRAFT_785606 [Mycena maculata]|uniref:Uncharacterized protein n=1 Tax=Mycena maculata TaxID=230809 RepID=A0AAD7H926_9AGAR|nr:hypothetical protein DFH07DRAFT_785606 [Mycena maculata]
MRVQARRKQILSGGRAGGQQAGSTATHLIWRANDAAAREGPCLRQEYRLVELQYRMALNTAGYADNQESTMLFVDRIAALRTKEAAFGEFKFSWRRHIPVTFAATGLYELSAGIYFLGESSRQALRYIQLPSEPDTYDALPVDWERIALRSRNNTVIIDFGLAIQEHDLIVFATFTPTPGQQLPTTTSPNTEGLVKLEFLSMSTHQAHPEASGPIEVETSRWGLPNIILEVVGDHLVFVVRHGRAVVDPPPDNVYVYKWRTRNLIKHITAAPHTYFGAVFLTPEVVVLPNTTAASLELWRITSAESQPALTLHLPSILPHARLRIFAARGEPNPSLHQMRMDPRLPFSASVESSVIFFHLDFLHEAFPLFVHRRTLLALLAAHPHPPADGLRYAMWGPDVCRWLDAVGMHTEWITMSAGQRCVVCPRLGPVSFFLLDFTPHSVPSPVT